MRRKIADFIGNFLAPFMDGALAMTSILAPLWILIKPRKSTVRGVIFLICDALAYLGINWKMDALGSDAWEVYDGLDDKIYNMISKK